jgi:hypothetical protein
MSVIERKTRHQRTFERDSGGSKPYSLVATNSCGTRKTERCIGEAASYHEREKDRYRWSEVGKPTVIDNATFHHGDHPPPLRLVRIPDSQIDLNV